MTDTCSLFDSTPRHPHKPCSKPAVDVLVTAYGVGKGNERPICEKHAKLFRGKYGRFQLRSQRAR